MSFDNMLNKIKLIFNNNYPDGLHTNYLIGSQHEYMIEEQDININLDIDENPPIPLHRMPLTRWGESISTCDTWEYRVKKQAMEKVSISQMSGMRS